MRSFKAVKREFIDSSEEYNMENGLIQLFEFFLKHFLSQGLSYYRIVSKRAIFSKKRYSKEIYQQGHNAKEKG